MNLEGIKLSEEIKGTIKAVPLRDWEAFFESLKDQEAKSIVATEDVDLPKLKARITVLDEIKSLFIHQIRTINLEH